MSTAHQVGRTRDVGFEIGVSRTFDCPVPEAWDVLTGAGVAVWLGQLDGPLPEQAGATGRTTDGTVFEIRSFRPVDRMRLVWTPAGAAADSTLQFTVRESAPGRTRVNFHQERLADGHERSACRDHWRQVLDRLEPLLTDTSGADTEA